MFQPVTERSWKSAWTRPPTCLACWCCSTACSAGRSLNHPRSERSEGDQDAKNLQEIIDRADELSAAFDDIQPDPAAGRDPAPLLRAREAVQARAHAEADVADAVAVHACPAGYSWQAIGAVVGTSGEAARQRYGGEAPKPGASTATTSGPVKTVRAESAPKTTRRHCEVCSREASCQEWVGEVIGSEVGSAVFGAKS